MNRKSVLMESWSWSSSVPTHLFLINGEKAANPEWASPVPTAMHGGAGASVERIEVGVCSGASSI